MKIKITSLLMIFSLNVSASGPYLGIECQGLNMPYNAGYGDNLLNRSTFGFNPIIGYRFNENISIEGGFRYHAHKRTTTLKEGALSAGEPISQYISPITQVTSMRLYGPHLSLIFSTPIVETHPIQLFAGLGLSSMHITFNRQTLHMGQYSFTHLNRKMAHHKVLKREMLGFNYFLTNNLALRGSVIFEDTNKLKAFANDGVVTSRQPRILPKRSVNYAIGIVYHF